MRGADEEERAGAWVCIPGAIGSVRKEGWRILFSTGNYEGTMANGVGALCVDEERGTMR